MTQWRVLAGARSHGGYCERKKTQKINVTIWAFVCRRLLSGTETDVKMFSVETARTAVNYATANRGWRKTVHVYNTHTHVIVYMYTLCLSVCAFEYKAIILDLFGAHIRQINIR